MITMPKIKEIDLEETQLVGSPVAEKLNEIIQIIDNLKCVEEEVPIYETLAPNECLIISKDDDGLLVATNRLGTVDLKRVPFPEEEE